MVEGLRYAVVFCSEALTGFGVLIRVDGDYDSSTYTASVGVVQSLDPETTVTQFGAVKMEAEYLSDIPRGDGPIIEAPIGSGKFVVVKFPLRKSG